MPIDPPQGHSQSEVLDIITEAIARLRKIETTFTGDTGDVAADFNVPDNKDMAEAQAKHKEETKAADKKEENAAKKAKGGGQSSHNA